ncbi:lipoprotein [Clostridium tetani]|uniref:Copper amine oxidase-like N-terminal domain-containing protein n=1 Tax=Clostridium tetani TaxID=1513 RepID=A0A4Q0VAP2_CLOTA|nr:DUF2334 domain-containing protein [Clostridium tetani]AVP56008.1 hypothetical protein C3B72_13105 [Clostridium tetani]RXI45383.1 hypothetical protein DP130_12285 [Clostridium tetani]RXI74637.1 hypothetical protein DP128_12720 [Clostridium tetani]WFN62516.1 DUF2334 domain-containing protein [Clostridium tetani]SUY54707.1 lipoprotein [Clostridium tetani]
MNKSKKIGVVFFSIFILLSFFVFLKGNYYKKENKSIEVKKTFSSGLNMNKGDINLFYNGKKLSLKLPIYVENNRYYIPLKEVIKNMDGEGYIKNNKIYGKLQDKYIEIDIKNNMELEGAHKLKQNLIVKDHIVYIGLFDFTKIFNLKTKWEEEKKIVDLYLNKDPILTKKKTIEEGKTAFIRLEDIVSTQRYKTQESLEKLRIISDYLYLENIPFHVAWIPRYIDKQKGIDEDPSRDYSIHNANFIYTMDYFMDRGGLIGLHGYTHQYGDEISIDGTEFNERRNTSEDQINSRINLAIESAKKLNIPICFFESSHYDATDMQHRVIEKHFKYMYEPPKFDSKNNIAKRQSIGREVVYIPTPLNYVDGKQDTNNMIYKINKLDNKTLASFFYHPNIEFEYINLYKDEKGYPQYTYDENSPLKRITKTLKERNYMFKRIIDI